MDKEFLVGILIPIITAATVWAFVAFVTWSAAWWNITTIVDRAGIAIVYAITASAAEWIWYIKNNG